MTQSRTPSGATVRHSRFGVGKVEVDKGETVLVRFEHGFEECHGTDVESVVSAEAALQRPEWDSALDVVLKCQAAAIRSVQDGWGVFARSRIQLLPHQLWVCRRVVERWPARWVVADDVGLGKTIEAGLALMALLSSRRIQRVLVLCPASLVEQWLVRLRTMFDLRFAPYTTEADTPKSDFWGTHNQVVASLETMRLDQKDRWARLVEAPAYDLLIVDEAHRLSDDEQGGPSLGYRLVDALESTGRLASVLLFTGTPHRGKDYGFLSLLQLLHRDRFDPKRPLSEQLDRLAGVMIRNNKQAVTDLKGNRIFKKLTVEQRTYVYSEAEKHFYGTLTDFISTGRAYANTLGRVQGQAVNLVLVAMQKLASSSVAAIRRALMGRLDRIAASRRDLQKLEEERASMTEILRSERNFDFDAMNLLDEAIAEREFELRLMADEEDRIRELVDLAKAVGPETKITEIVKLLGGELVDRSVLFFTEYKATQALLVSALHARFGEGCAVFINGDGALESVEGRRGPWTLPREEATERFNEGTVRFLVSTEAGGEGIDLQRSCHTLVHVDLPWNPMRLHQRVGRLHRLGQTHDVQVYSFRNPATVEARIWDLLNAKINRIQAALSSVMDDPEDLFQLVLGMTSPAMFREVFAGAASAPKKEEQLNSWFDARTATFGGRDVIEVVKSIVGHCQRFDFQGVSAQVPKVDLPDLRQFFVNALVANRRRPQDEAGGALSFKTPDAWRKPGIPIFPSYTAQRFERPITPGGRLEGVLGAGHPLLEAALAQALDLPATVATFKRADSLGAPLVVLRAFDRVTTTTSSVRAVILGVSVRESGPVLLRDWQLLQHLNVLTIGRAERLERSPIPNDPPAVRAVVQEAVRFAGEHLADIDVSFEVPEVSVVAMLWPSQE